MVASNRTRQLSGSKYRYGVETLEDGKTFKRDGSGVRERWHIEGVTDPKYEQRAFSNTAASGPRESASSPNVLKQSDNGLSIRKLIFMLSIVDCDFTPIKLDQGWGLEKSDWTERINFKGLTSDFSWRPFIVICLAIRNSNLLFGIGCPLAAESWGLCCRDASRRTGL